MSLKNTTERFGSLTKFLHWLIAILFFVQFYLVYRREYFPKNAPEKLQYLLLHVSLGVCVLILAFLMLIWRHVGTRPSLPNMASWEKGLARTTHFLLYATMLIQPISGIVMSILGGYPVAVFGWFELPMFLPQNKELGHLVFEIHQITSFIIIGLVGLHSFAALYHHFIRKDDVLRRMLPGG